MGRGVYAKPEVQKTKRRFMQKYYHKGAFYMDEESIREKDDVRRRAADDATGEDKFNRAALPQVMQVKKFGRAGQTKYTHLLDQDTTRAEKHKTGSVWQQRDQDKRQGVVGEAKNRFAHKLGGTGDIDSAGRRKKQG